MSAVIYGSEDVRLHRNKIISSRLELEDFQDTGERAIRWLKRRGPKPTPAF